MVVVMMLAMERNATKEKKTNKISTIKEQNIVKIFATRKDTIDFEQFMRFGTCIRKHFFKWHDEKNLQPPKLKDDIWLAMNVHLLGMHTPMGWFLAYVCFEFAKLRAFPSHCVAMIRSMCLINLWKKRKLFQQVRIEEKRNLHNETYNCITLRMPAKPFWWIFFSFLLALNDLKLEWRKWFVETTLNMNIKHCIKHATGKWQEKKIHRGQVNWIVVLCNKCNSFFACFHSLLTISLFQTHKKRNHEYKWDHCCWECWNVKIRNQQIVRKEHFHRNYCGAYNCSVRIFTDFG